MKKVIVENKNSTSGEFEGCRIYCRPKIISTLLIFSLFIGLVEGNAQEYKRIISLAASLTKNIYYLNSNDKLVGCTNYCLEAKAENIDIVATAVKVNLEKVVSKNPDLILATQITNPETIESLKKFGFRVEIFPTPKTFEELCEQFIRMGKLIGKTQLAESVINSTKVKVDSIRSTISWKKSPKIFFQIGTKPLFSVLPNTFMDDYINFLKGTNIASDLKKGTIAREVVLARNPDIIFITTMGVLGTQEKQNWLKYTNLNAVVDKMVFVVDSDLSCTPTPVSFLKTFEILANYVSK